MLESSNLEHIWQVLFRTDYFCGEIEVQHKPPCVANELSAFRKRIGEEGAKFIFSISVGIHGSEAQEKRAVVDSTVQVKNITYPTDAKEPLNRSVLLR